MSIEIDVLDVYQVERDTNNNIGKLITLPLARCPSFRSLFRSSLTTHLYGVNVHTYDTPSHLERLNFALALGALVLRRRYRSTDQLIGI